MNGSSFCFFFLQNRPTQKFWIIQDPIWLACKTVFQFSLAFYGKDDSQARKDLDVLGTSVSSCPRLSESHRVRCAPNHFFRFLDVFAGNQILDPKESTNS